MELKKCVKCGKESYDVRDGYCLGCRIKYPQFRINHQSRSIAKRKKRRIDLWVYQNILGTVDDRCDDPVLFAGLLKNIFIMQYGIEPDKIDREIYVVH